MKEETPIYTLNGLNETEVAGLRAKYGYNELPAPHENALLSYLKNFWGPLPWLMELLVFLSFFSGQRIEGGVIALLLFLNSLVSSMQRRTSDAALATLVKNLSVSARVKRNGNWQSIQTRELLPGDIIRVRTGDIVPADAKIVEGNISVDVSSLTGESLPKDVASGDDIFSGSVVRRGEATAQVTSIGISTAYGKTAELLETSHPPTHMEKIIFSIIKYLFFLNLFLAFVIIVFGIAVHAEETEIINFVIVLLLTSVPVAFPTMFAVAQSYGALDLAKSKDKGVLVHRLAAVQEFAMVDVLCSDKTGTLTKNELKVVSVQSYGTFEQDDVLSFAMVASDEADKDSIDEAIFEEAKSRNITSPAKKNFKPFDPITKRTEADMVSKNGENVHILMGLPELLLNSEIPNHDDIKNDVLKLSEKGLRVVAVVIEDGALGTQCAGIIALADPIRDDASEMLQELKELGIRVVMITGDGLATARTVASELGLSGKVITASELKNNPEEAVEASVFAEAYPEDKLTIIRAFQRTGHTVAMTGDGVNDAPALRQAEVGIAVLGATDVAKQSASFILTSSGLEGVVRAVKVSRSVYARLRTWALNKILKSFEVSFFTTIIFFITKSYILTPLLAVLLIFANDFVTISIATDNTKPVDYPGHWHIGSFILGVAVLSIAPLLILWPTYFFTQWQGFSLDVTRTAVYLALIVYGKANLYGLRAWPHAWNVRPSRTLVLATSFSVIFAATISGFGVLIAPVPMMYILLVLAAGIVNFFFIDFIKHTRLLKKLLAY